MALKDELDEYTSVDREYGKRSRKLWDLTASFYNKQLQTVNILGMDLYNYAKDAANRNGKWVVKPNAYLDANFPRGRNLPDGFAEFPSYTAFNHNIGFTRKSRSDKTGFNFTVYVDREKFGWYAGQWDEDKKGERLFEIPFYDRINKSLKFPIDVNARSEVEYPGAENIEYEVAEGELDIHIWCFVDGRFSKEKLLGMHELVKQRVFGEMIRDLRRRRLI